MKRSVWLACALAGLACCAPAPAVVMDPADNPAVLAGAAAVSAQPVQPGAPAPVLSLPQLRADFMRAAGADTIYFSSSRDAHAVDDAARGILTRQAAWLRANPFLTARIEGHADGRHSREFALALGERRANAVRNFLLTQGVAPEQLTVLSWGRERPATPAAHDATWLENGRVVTVIMPPAPAALPPPLF